MEKRATRKEIARYQVVRKKAAEDYQRKKAVENLATSDTKYFCVGASTINGFGVGDGLFCLLMRVYVDC